MKIQSKLAKNLLTRYFVSLTVMVLPMIVVPLIMKYFARFRIWYDGDPTYELLKVIETILYPSIIIYGLGAWIILTTYFIKKALGYLDETIQATNQLVTEPERPIHLSANLMDVEHEMNEIRERNLLNQRAAKEAEQRKNDLIVYLAHDLRTPLTSVIGYLTLLREELDLSTELRARYTSIALEEAERLEQLIGEFFEITRFNLTTMTLDKEKVDISVMLEQLSYEFLPVMQEKQLTWELALQKELYCALDPEKMERAFDNLIRNAINYSEEKSVLHLSLTQIDAHIRIQLTNTGKTIPKEKLTRIFEPFYCVDTARQSATGGTGLGLPITKEMIDLHGVTIYAESENNKIFFTILLDVIQKTRNEVKIIPCFFI